MCPLPNQPEYSFFRITSLIVGANVTYTCQQGFEITKGNRIRQCLMNQTWSGLDPNCTRKY